MVVGLAFLAGPALAQAPAADAEPSVRLASKSAPADRSSAAEATLSYFNRPIAVFRTPVYGLPVDERARRTVLRLDAVFSRHGPGAVTVKKEPQGNLLLVDNEPAFMLTEGDTDRLHGETLEAATASAVKALEQVIAETREVRDRGRILEGALFALAVTAIYVLLCWLVVRGRRWVRAKLALVLQHGAGSVEAMRTHILSPEHTVKVAGWAAWIASWALLLLFTYEWLSVIFRQFPYTRPWGEELKNYLLGIVAKLLQAVIGSIPDLVIAILIFIIARGVIGLVAPLFDNAQAGRSEIGWINADTARPARRLFSVAVWLFAIVMAYPYLPGSNSEAFKGMSVLIGLVVTIGGSNVFNQWASGYILMASRTLRVGEYVRVSDHEGTVTEVGTFAVHIRTGLGEELSLPNALVLGAVTRNYSRVVNGKGFVVDTVVTIGYDTPWRQVEAMLIEAARRTPGVLENPAPKVFQTGLSDFYPEYRLVAQAVPSDPRPRAEVMSNLHANVQDVFNEHGVQIMSPHYLADPEKPKVVAPADWYPAPAKPPQTG